MSNSQEEKKLVFIAAVVGNKVKRNETESHRRHRTFVLVGGKNWYFEGFFFKSPRWCSLDLGTDYHRECTHKNNTGLA